MLTVSTQGSVRLTKLRRRLLTFCALASFLLWALIAIGWIVSFVRADFVFLPTSDPSVSLMVGQSRGSLMVGEPYSHGGTRTSIDHSSHGPSPIGNYIWYFV